MFYYTYWYLSSNKPATKNVQVSSQKNLFSFKMRWSSICWIETTLSSNNKSGLMLYANRRTAKREEKEEKKTYSLKDAWKVPLQIQNHYSRDRNEKTNIFLDSFQFIV